MIWRFVIITVIVLAVFFIFTSLSFGDILGGPETAVKNATEEGDLNFYLLVDKMSFDAVPRKSGDFWDYRITLTSDVRPVGIVKPTDGIFALVSFKGVDARARLETQNGAQDTFSVIDDEPQTGMVFVADVTSREPPVKKVTNNYIGSMVLGQTLVLESSTKGDFQVTLSSLETRIFGLSQYCDPVFTVGCSKNTSVRQRFKLTENCPEEENDNCKKTVDICDGAIDVTLIEKASCSEVEKARIFVESGRNEALGEEIGISFFLDTICTKPLKTYERMKSYCKKSFLGGRYDFVKPVI